MKGPSAAGEPMGTCTESRALPTVDLLGSVGALAIGILALSASQDDDAQTLGLGETFGQMAGIYLAGGAVYGFSAYKGFSRTSACRESLRELQESMAAALQEGVAEATSRGPMPGR